MYNTKETGNYGEIQASNYLVKKDIQSLPKTTMASMER